MQFESFYWLSHYTTLYKYGKPKSDFWDIFYFSLVMYILGVFLIKQYYSTRTCWIWDSYSQLGAMRLIGYLSPHIRHVLMEYLITWNFHDTFISRFCGAHISWHLNSVILRKFCILNHFNFAFLSNMYLFP